MNSSLLGKSHEDASRTIFPRGEICWENTRHQLFSVDPNGTLFIGEKRALRVLSHDSWCLLLELLPSLESLTQAGLIKIWVEDSDLRRVEQEYVSFITYPSEWTMGMMKEAVLCMLNLSVELARHKCILHDAHPWNVTFQRCQPTYLDFSSIKRGEKPTDWWFQEFFTHCYLPLWLASYKQLRKLGQDCLGELHSDCTASGRVGPVKRLFSRRKSSFLFRTFNRALKDFNRNGNFANFLLAMIDNISSMDVTPPPSEWSNYPEPSLLFDTSESDTEKSRAYKKLIAKLKPGRLLDVGCNSGWYAAYADGRGYTTLGIDLDEFALDKARERGKKLSNSQFAFSNPLKPTPPFGRALTYQSSLARWQVDTMLLIAVSHHLCIRQGVSFDSLVALAKLYGAKNVLVEFIPSCDSHLIKWQQAGVKMPAGYSESAFVESWSKEYHLVDKCWTENTEISVDEVDRYRKLFLFTS